MDQAKAILMRLCERIETVTRDEIGWLVPCVYGFQDADAEELIATREW
ncbi:DUF5713 family protein [Nocardia sp. NPDC050718]